MDADDLARGRALLAQVSDVTGSWEDWQIAKNHWQSWVAQHAAALLDAAERAARLEAALRRLRLLANSYMLARLMGDDPLDEFRAALERPKGAGDE